MDVYQLLTVFSGIALAISAFIILYLLYIKKEKSRKRYVLALLIFAVALRLSKSVFYYLFPNLSSLGVALGFLGFSSIGPLSYYYFDLVIKGKNSSVYSTYLFHIVYPVMGFLMILVLNQYAYFFYLTCNFSLAAYLGYTLYVLRTSNKTVNEELTKWDRSLLLALVFIFFTFLFQMFAPSIETYTLGTGISSFILYSLFFLMLKYPPRLSDSYHDIPVKSQDAQKIVYALESEKIYRQPSITLSQFSEILNVPQYMISRVTRKTYGKSFPEVINSLRIAEVVDKLKDPEYQNLKLEALAYDVGFSTISSFYATFKKETSMTPREYQRIHFN